MTRRPPAGRRAAVLGSPIAHSLSPVLHRAAYAELGLDWRYDAIEVREGQLAAFVAGLDRTWAGLSLTMPLKAEASALARMRSNTVTATGAANTLLPLGAGWSAENTDVPGLVAALAEAGTARADVAGVLGGGATAASAVTALARIGASRIEVALRTTAKAAPLVELGGRWNVEVVARPWTDAAAVAALPVVVSTVPAGASAELAAHLPIAPALLFDVIYDPWPTPLVAAWSAAGGRVVGGLDLLVHQAVLQVELMSGLRPQVETLRAAGLAALGAR